MKRQILITPDECRMLYRAVRGEIERIKTVSQRDSWTASVRAMALADYDMLLRKVVQAWRRFPRSVMLEAPLSADRSGSNKVGE